MAKNKEPPKLQQDFLRDAMFKLGLTRDQFAARFGINRRRFDNWLLPSESAQYREMDEAARKFVQEVLGYQERYEGVVVKLKEYANARVQDAEQGVDSRTAITHMRLYGAGAAMAVIELFGDERAADPINEFVDQEVSRISRLGSRAGR